MDIEFAHLRNLVIVAAHAVYKGKSFKNPTKDRNWHLLPFQYGKPPFFIEHIRMGVESAAADERSLLVFSGGQTRAAAGPRSEAQGYWIIADHFKWWITPQVRSRATTEEFARDSFENLLFSICRFHECVGRYPESVEVVSWTFKKKRFDIHREAIRFPKSRFTFKGLVNPVNPRSAMKGEKNTRKKFEKDLYGTGYDLGDKRVRSNPFNRQHPYLTSCRGLRKLLRHKGPKLFRGRLPW